MTWQILLLDTIVAATKRCERSFCCLRRMSKIPTIKPTIPTVKPNPWLLGNLPHLHAKITSFAMPTFVNGRWRPAKWNGRKLRMFRYQMEERGIPWPEIPRTWNATVTPTRDFNIRVGKLTKELRGKDARYDLRY